MSNDKIYRNSARDNSAPPNKYIPNYKLMGLTPENGDSIARPLAVPIPKSEQEIQEALNNPRISRAVNTQLPYATEQPSPMGPGKSPMLNVGNNMEHTWSSVDGDIIMDDADLQNSSLSENDKMIDNNEFVSDKALGLPPSQPSKTLSSKDHTNSYVSNYIGEYILFLKGKIIFEGSLNDVQEEVRKLVFGADNLSVDDIEVLKRVKIKIGVFLE
jgi:hypothetical protein